MARKRKAAPAARKAKASRKPALVARARRAEQVVRARTREQLKTLKRKQVEAKSALAKLGRQSAAAGAPLKSGLQKAWRDLDLAVRQAGRRFRDTP